MHQSITLGARADIDSCSTRSERMAVHQAAFKRGSPAVRKHVQKVNAADGNLDGRLAFVEVAQNGDWTLIVTLLVLMQCK